MQRRDHNDIIGWQVSVLGTTYAVIIGFMLYAVWTTLQSAEINADSEANCLVNAFRLADGLPAAQRVQVHQLARQYAEVVINEEWPAMLQGRLQPTGHGVIQQLWTVLLQTRPTNFSGAEQHEHDAGRSFEHDRAPAHARITKPRPNCRRFCGWC